MNPKISLENFNLLLPLLITRLKFSKTKKLFLLFSLFSSSSTSQAVVDNHSSVVKLIKEKFFQFFSYSSSSHAHHNSFIQMFCAENCFIGNEWKAATKWLMKNIMRQSDTKFSFLFFFSLRQKKRRNFPINFFCLCFMLGYF